MTIRTLRNIEKNDIIIRTTKPDFTKKQTNKNKPEKPIKT